MRTFILLCCTSAFSFTSSNLFAQDAKVFIETEQTLTIFEVFELIAKQTDCTFIYQSDIFTDVPQIHLKNGEIKVMTLLAQCLPAHRFEINSNKDNLITISRKSPKILKKDLQQEIRGKIMDGGGMPIAGAAIMVVGTNKGAASDFDGHFSIAAMPTDTLKVSYLGYTTITVPINNRTTIDVTIQEDATALKEVQINAGYYTTTDREKTGSISRITAKEIDKQPVNNPLGAMQGYMSGVNIVQNTGVPGGGYDIQIRGKNFINGETDPLFIIDGVPFSSKSMGVSTISNQIVGGNISPLNAINPNDIESIEVLKDADATAIYGSRAANGVVLITTKRGRTDKTQFITNFSTSFGEVSNFLNLMNTKQYLEVRKEGIENDGLNNLLDNPAYDFFWPDIKNWDENRYTDWQKELIGGTAYRNKAELSVSGGNSNTHFLISGAYQNETTVFPGDFKYKKANLRSNVNHQSANDRVKLNFSTGYTRENNHLPSIDFSTKAYNLEPNAPELYDEEGNINWENNTWDNPLASLEENFNAVSNTLMSNAQISYSVTPELEIKSSMGFTTYRLDSYRAMPSSARNPRLGLTPQNYSNFMTNTSQRESWIVEPQISWKTQWNHLKINILIGTTFQTESTDQLVVRGSGFPNNELIRNLAAAEKVQIISDMNGEYNYSALFGRINFNFLNNYILNLTGRRDGSSRFGPGKQFGNFGAVGLAWIFSNESIFTEGSTLSFGKMRASYGTTGSDNIGDYRFLNTYTVTGKKYNGVTIVKPTGIFNPQFGWEENRKIETALKLGFFKDRLLLNTSWYQNRSSNQLVGIPLAATTGFSELTGNFDAVVENSGFEFDLRTVNIQSNKFRWSTNFNFTIPKNRLVSFDNLETSTFANRYVIGKPLTIVKLYHSLGVDPETGIYEFTDYNDDGNIGRWEDRQWVEDLSPQFYGGLGNTFSMGNLTLDIFFQFKRQKAYNTLRFDATPGFTGNKTVDLYDRWKTVGDVKTIQRASSGMTFSGDRGSFQQESNAAVSDASFVRLRNISLNYTVPSLGNRRDVKIYLQGQNLLTLTKYTGLDPEFPSYTRLPPLRQITLGIQLSF